MLKKIAFFTLVFFLTAFANAEDFENDSLPPEAFKKDECVLIQKGKITHGACLAHSFYFKRGINAAILFNGIKYQADFLNCSDNPRPHCRDGLLSSENDKNSKYDDAKELYRNANFKIVSDSYQKFHCLKRKGAGEQAYELCFKNVNYSGN